MTYFLLVSCIFSAQTYVAHFQQSANECFFQNLCKEWIAGYVECRENVFNRENRLLHKYHSNDIEVKI